jgi:DNA-binding beta-propeller fold protein YncE
MRKLSIIFLFTVISSCGQVKTPNDSPFVIDPEKFPEDMITLSEIADDIKYIPLDDTIPFEGIYSIEITAKNIYISMQYVGIVKYDREGNFEKVIARKGRGPGELYWGHDFVVDEGSKKVYVADRHKILVYTIEGTYLKDISTKDYFFTVANDIELSGSKLYLCDFGYMNGFKYHWAFLDTTGKLVSAKITSDHSTGHVPCGFSYKFNGNIYYSNILNDTVFSVSPDFKARAAFLFSKGEYRWPVDYQLISLEDAALHFRPLQMFETNRFVFLRYGYMDKAAYLIIDKSANKAYQAYKKGKSGLVNYMPAIPNDLDCGLFAAYDDANYYSENGDEYITYFVSPYELKSHVSGDEFKNSVPKYPEKKKELEMFANSLKETDNPVLVMVRIKK